MNYLEYWIHLKFTVIKSITNLPLYTGIHWSAFFRNELRRITSQSIDELDLNVIPANNNIHSLAPGEKVSIILSTNESGYLVLQKWISLVKNEEIKTLSDNDHFILKETIELES
ncbi:MAG: hypothetical protein PHR06_13895, partial [Candidatus Cloacimonetes bacterium]|nr:hypothetical protein [Candidatus Cloacimonadota bacterium]